jgi:carbon monoxide dehydrogenase subunit G
MAEKLVNEFTVNRPIDQAWAVITDVERIAPCLPGAELQEIEGDVFRGIVKVKLGSISPQFKGQAKFAERDDAAHQAMLEAEGRDTGGRGNASAKITVQAESLSPTSTKVIVTTDLQITGKVAQFGRGIIGDVSKKLMEQFANNLNAMLDAEPMATNGADESGTAAAPADGDEPAGTANSTARSVAPETTETTAASATDDAGDVPVTPRVRKIEGPATEPVDLAGVAGPAILKRLLPIVAGLLVLLFVLRRRR